MSSQSRVKVVASTSGSIGVMVNGELVVDSAGSPGFAVVTDGDDNLLSWHVEGDPGTEYSVTLSTSDATEKIETSPEGSNPVKSRISSRLFRGGGQIRFKVLKKE